MSQIKSALIILGILLMAAPAFSICETDEYYWTPIDWGIVGDSVWMTGTMMATYNNQLVTVANFNGSHSSCVISWDGTDWTILGWSNSYMQPVIVYDGQLVVGGDYTNIGGIYSPNLAVYDGANWSSLGSNPNSSVPRMAIYNDGGQDKLVIGGPFNRVGYVNAYHIARWNGLAWTAFGSGTNELVHAMTTMDGNLYAGGWFTAAGGQGVNYVAAWNGTSWSPMAEGIHGGSDPFAFVMTTYHDRVIVGGGFDSAGTIAAKNLAAWDGSTWSAVGTGIAASSSLQYPAVYSLYVFDGKLIVGGRFDSAGGLPVTNIAAWDGASWKAIGTEATDVSALHEYSGELYATGGFQFPGETEAKRHLAKMVRRSYEAGDVNGDKLVNIKDITFTINFLYREGLAPVPMNAADTDGNTLVNIKDITYLINFLYRSGPVPKCK